MTRMRTPQTMLVLVVLATCVGLSDSSALAQAQPAAFKTLPIHNFLLDPKSGRPDRRKLTQVNAIRNKAINQGLDASQRDAFLGYYNNYIFPMMTQPWAAGEVAELRVDLLDDIRKARTQAVRDLLIEACFNQGRELIKPEYHPYVRYNALLLLAGLNQQEAETVTTKREAVAYAPAFPILLAELTKADQSDAMLLAAMVGIKRHVRLDREGGSSAINANDKNRILQEMMKLVSSKATPAGRDAEGHVWLRQRAVDIIAELGSLGANNEVLTAFDTILKDDEEPMDLKLAVSDGLGRLQYPQGATGDVVALANELGAVAALACYQERDRYAPQATKAPQEDTGSTAGGFNPYESGEDEAKPVVSDSEASSLELRRRLKYQLNAVLLGLRGKPVRRSAFSTNNADQGGGIKRLGQDPKLDAIITAVEQLYEVTNDDSGDLARLVENMVAKAESLEKLLPEPVRKPEEKAEEGQDDTKKPAKPKPGSDLPGGDLPGGDLPGGF